MRYSSTVLHPPWPENFHSFPPSLVQDPAINSSHISICASIFPCLSVLKITSWCVHVSGRKVHCSGPCYSLLVPVRTRIVTSWRLALTDQTSLSCILLLQLPPCPLWTQISCSVITASLLSLSSVMPVHLYTASCLGPGQVSALCRASCMKVHYIL